MEDLRQGSLKEGKNERVRIQDVKCLVTEVMSKQSKKKKNEEFILTAESTSYTRKPELRLFNGVIEGPI